MTAGRPFSVHLLGRKRLTAVIAFLALAAGTVLGLGAQNAIWEGWFVDRLFQAKSLLSQEEKSQRAPVAVVGLDQVSLNSDRLATVPRVFMSPVLATAGQAVLDAGAAGVGYDFVFAFSADSFADPNTGEERLRGFDRPFLRFLYQNRGKVFVSRTSTGVPHRAISAAAGTSGVRFAEVSPDTDGVVRRHTPEFPLIDSPLLIDALLASADASISTSYTMIPEHRLASSIPYLSLIDLLALTETEAGREEIKAFSEGRVILFGSTMPNEDEHLYSDRFLPQMSAEIAETGESGRPGVRHATAGVFVLADMVGAALSGRIALDPPAGTLALLAFVFAVAGTAAGLLLPLWIVPVVAVGGISVAFGISLIGLQSGYLIAPGVAPVAVIASMIVAAIGKVGVLQRRQRSLVNLFGHYLSEDVIKQMADSEELPALGGETRHVVVAFLDIVGFTKMSEKLPDHEVVRVVNTCFDMIGQVITKHGGYIDKYIGDAIMAVWNAPNTVENPEQAAVDASREIIALLDEIRKETGQGSLDLRIALNAGPVLVGDIGGEHRRSFTVMGTTVNTASRIESVAKDRKVRLAFSDPVASNLQDGYPVKNIWSGRLRGLSHDTQVFTVDDPAVFMEGATAQLPANGKNQKADNLVKFSS
ncbi:adenylate/guanylate cyclase domain-containing protein [Roseibium sp.]|uniref:adenylate/guanylate cyclase domain-containing protein n=1 Tax=Roseibium sp. TaxID=1936156 RepID=UPI003B5056C5